MRRVRRVTYKCIYCVQKLLLLPELSNTAVTGTDSDPVNATNKLYFLNIVPTVELINDDRREPLLNSRTPRVIVSDLTASWTHVRR